jgi:ATP-dependent DNA helicase RecQ
VREVVDRGLDRVPTYGKLASMPADEVKDLLNVLADAGLIDRHGIQGGRPGAFVLALTPEGRRVAKGEHRPELALPAAVPRRVPRARAGRRGREAAPAVAPAVAAEGDPVILERLKVWRREEARRQGKPSYVIFHDSTLEALAAVRPRDRDTLQQVKGIGPAKLEAYGDTLLELLQ